MREDLPTKPIRWESSVKVHLEWYLPRSREMDVDVEGVVVVNLVPECRKSEKSSPPVTTDLCAEVCKVGRDVGCEGADVGEDFGWEFVDWCERVSHRSEGADSFNEASFGADDLRRLVSRVLDRRGARVLLRGKGSDLRCHPRSLSSRIIGVPGTDELTCRFEHMPRA